MWISFNGHSSLTDPTHHLVRIAVWYWFSQEMKHGGSAAQRQQDDPSASWAVQQFWQRSSSMQLAGASAALHPASQCPFPSAFCLLHLLLCPCAHDYCLCLVPTNPLPYGLCPSHLSLSLVCTALLCASTPALQCLQYNTSCAVLCSGALCYLVQRVV